MARGHCHTSAALIAATAGVFAVAPATAYAQQAPTPAAIEASPPRVIDRPLVRDRGVEGSLAMRVPLAARDDDFLDFAYLDMRGRFGTRRLEVFGSIGLAVARANAADVIDRGTIGVRVAAGSAGALRLGAFFLQPTETTETSRFAMQGAFELRRRLHDRVALRAEGGLEFVNRIWGDEVPEPAQSWWSLSALAGAHVLWQATTRVALSASVGVQVPLAANPGDGEPDAVLGASYDVDTTVVGDLQAVIAIVEAADAFVRLERTPGRSDFSFQWRTETITATAGVSARW